MIILAFQGLKLTEKGKLALLEAQNGKKLEFDYIAIGSGIQEENTIIQDMLELVFTIPIVNVVLEKNICIIEADLDNKNLKHGYYFRELGIYLKTEEGSFLYAYDNAGENAEYILESNDVPTIEKRLRFHLNVENASNITFTGESVLYVTQKSFEQTIKGVETKHNQDIQTISEKHSQDISLIAEKHNQDIQNLVQAHQNDIQTIAQAHQQDIAAINVELDNTKKSVSDGKSRVAAAITRKRIETAADATFQQMSDNIDRIALGWGNAVEWQVLEGVSFSNADGVERIGTMPNQSLEALKHSPIALGFHVHGDTWSEAGGINTFLHAPAGYYDGNTWLGIACPNLKASNLMSGVQIGTDGAIMTGTATDDANAVNNDILEGKSAYVKGRKIEGGITSHARNPTAIPYIRNNNNRVEVAVPWGFYECYWEDGSYEYLTYEQIAQTIGLHSGVLRAGYNICGVQGDAWIVWTGDSALLSAALLEGYSGWSNGEKINGSMHYRGAINVELNAGASYVVPDGYHDGNGRVTTKSLSSQTSATATNNDIVAGKTAWVNGNKVTGAIANQAAGTTALSFVADQNTIYIRIPAGAYLNPAGAGVPEVLLSTPNFLSAIGVTAEKILTGHQILGITGTGTTGSGTWESPYLIFDDEVKVEVGTSRTYTLVDKTYNMYKCKAAIFLVHAKDYLGNVYDSTMTIGLLEGIQRPSYSNDFYNLVNDHELNMRYTGSNNYDLRIKFGLVDLTAGRIHVGLSNLSSQTTPYYSFNVFRILMYKLK